MLISVGFLCGFHWFLIAFNYTTYEWHKQENKTFPIGQIPKHVLLFCREPLEQSKLHMQKRVDELDNGILKHSNHEYRSSQNFDEQAHLLAAKHNDTLVYSV